MGRFDNIPDEKVDEIWQIVINNPNAISKRDFEALRKRWHELHDGEIKGV